MNDYCALLHRLADAAGRVILPHYRTALVAENKLSDGGFDPVTAADRAAEQAMRVLLAEVAPDHGIIGEEFGRERDDAENVWVIDPIDGTRAFMSGMPTWGTLIALLQQGNAVLGSIDQPFTQERFFGDGERAWLRNRAGQHLIRSRHGVALEHAVIWVSSTFTTTPAEQARVERLRSRVRLLRYGSDCYAYAMVASGLIDAVVDKGLEIYDIAAHIPLISGAGGRVIGLDGAPPLRSTGIIAAGEADLAEAIRDLLA